LLYQKLAISILVLNRPLIYIPLFFINLLLCGCDSGLKSCQVKFVEPLMRSPIVSNEAFETMVKLARCTAPPLCDWALDISTALRLIVTDEVHLLLDLVPSVAEEEVNERPFRGLFERILEGLSVSCKSGALPVDSFSFVFPVSNYTLK